MIKSKYVDESSREDYTFIDEHSQIARQQHHQGKRSFGSVSSHLLPTSHRDSPPPSPNSRDGADGVAGTALARSSSDAMTPQSIREKRRRQNRKSLTTMKNPLVRKSRRLIYAVDFEHDMDMLVSMKLDLSDKKFAFMPRIKDRIMNFEIKEWRGNDSSTVAVVTTNLVDFTTPVHVMGQLKRCVLFPVRLRSNKLCKLRVTISSIWLNAHQFQMHLQSMIQSADEKQRKKYNEYFVVEEDEEQFFPAMNPSPIRAAAASASTPGVFTPRAAYRRDSDANTGDTATAGATQQASSNGGLSDSNGSRNSGSKPLVPPLMLHQHQSRDSPRESSMSDTSSSPPSATGFGISPRTSSFTQDASHFVIQLKKLKTEMAKLLQEKKDLQMKLQEREFQTTVDENDTPIASHLKAVINRVFGACSDLKEQLSHVEQSVNQIHGRVDLFERDRSGMPHFQASPGDEPRTVGLVYLDIHSKSRMWHMSQDAMIRVLHIYEELFADCLQQCSGSVLQTDGDSMVCCFSSCKMAIRFCLLLQIKLHNAAWPQELLELDAHDSNNMYNSLHRRLLRASFDEMDAELDLLPSVPRSKYQPLVRGLGVRMGIEVGRLMELSDTSSAPIISIPVRTAPGRALLSPGGPSDIDREKGISDSSTTTTARQSSMPTLRYFYHDSSKQFVFFGDALKRVIVISQYAQAGQIFISDYVWLCLQEENKMLKQHGVEEKYPPIRTIVQDLGMHQLNGLAMEDADDSTLDDGYLSDHQDDDAFLSHYVEKERLRLVIPEQLQGREYTRQQIEELELCTSQSFLVNSLYDCLDQWREKVIEKIKEQLNSFEEEMPRVNMLYRIYEEENRQKEQHSETEGGPLDLLSKKQQELTMQLLDTRSKCESIENRMTQLEQILRKMSTQVLVGDQLSEDVINSQTKMSDISATVQEQSRMIRNLVQQTLDFKSREEIKRVKEEYERKLLVRDLEIERLSKKYGLETSDTSSSSAVRKLDNTIMRTFSLLESFSFDDSSDEEMDDEDDSEMIHTTDITAVEDGKGTVDMEVMNGEDEDEDRVREIATPVRSAFRTPTRRITPSTPTSVHRRTPHSPALERLKHQNESIRQKIELYRNQQQT